ncbi:hypothetical protein [Sphingomonas sp.]|uniref:hypothetical protein n=1 Tax=Sphingomonas sp. TaxID=28214 RepID=UPI002DEFFBF2|nr:hypothetical protein [Sphingomonas sp.]
MRASRLGWKGPAWSMDEETGREWIEGSDVLLGQASVSAETIYSLLDMLRAHLTLPGTARSPCYTIAGVRRCFADPDADTERQCLVFDIDLDDVIVPVAVHERAFCPAEGSSLPDMISGLVDAIDAAAIGRTELLEQELGLRRALEGLVPSGVTPLWLRRRPEIVREFDAPLPPLPFEAVVLFSGSRPTPFLRGHNFLSGEKDLARWLNDIAPHQAAS